MRILLRSEVLRERAARENKPLGSFLRDRGLDERYIRRLMSGEHEPGPKLRARLCELLGVAFDDLFVFRPVERALQEPVRNAS